MWVLLKFVPPFVHSHWKWHLKLLRQPFYWGTMSWLLWITHRPQCQQLSWANSSCENCWQWGLRIMHGNQDTVSAVICQRYHRQQTKFPWLALFFWAVAGGRTPSLICQYETAKLPQLGRESSCLLGRPSTRSPVNTNQPSRMEEQQQLQPCLPSSVGGNKTCRAFSVVEPKNSL